VRVFDDGRRVFIEFAPSHRPERPAAALSVGPDGKTAELINYHVEARRLVVDRLFDRGELRLGGKRHAQAVRLTRLTPLTEASR
jgi:type IV secretory pathway VirB9-like protein